MLDLTQLMTYALSLLIAAIVPGPGMAALVARSVGGGAAAGTCLLLGLILGDLIYLSFAVFGLALIAEHFDLLFQLVRWGGCPLPGLPGLAFLVRRSPGDRGGTAGA